MAKIVAFAFGLTASMMASGMAVAANNAPTTGAGGAAQNIDKDFGRMSADGVSAFNDIHLARRALFRGQTNEAAKLVTDAKESLEKAKTDDSVFMKAESEFRSGAGQATAQQSRSQTAWVPIDGEVVLGEIYSSTPDKAAAVVTANKALEKGDRDKALQTIRLAAVDVNYVVGAAPLQQSLAQLDQANQLMASHDFYGAQEALRKAEEGIRYDEIDDVANVKTADKSNGRIK